MKADATAAAEAVRCLAAGGLVAFPTETVYGLGADAGNGEAVARLYAAKGRPTFNPLIAHVADFTAARRIGMFNAVAELLAKQFWPGPLTLVVPKTENCPVSELATAGLDTIAVRVPSHPVASDLLRRFRKPVVAPSANRSGHVSPTDAAHALTDLRGRIELIVDGGPTPVGVESTIIACFDRPVLLRPGGIPREAIERLLKMRLTSMIASAGEEGEAPPAPGMLASHYAPRAALRLNATAAREGEALLGFGPAAPADALNLSAKGDLVEAAANLFSYLRQLDGSGAKAIAVMKIPRDGLGEAINDRLSRAAAPR